MNFRLGTPPPTHYAEESDDEVDMSRDEEIDEEFIWLIDGIWDYDRLEVLYDEEEDAGRHTKARFIWRKMCYIEQRDRDEVGAELRNRIIGMNYDQVSDLYEELFNDGVSTEEQRAFVCQRLMELDEDEEEVEG